MFLNYCGILILTWLNRNKTVSEWKKHCDHLPFKTNKVISPALVNYSINSVLKPKQSSKSTFQSRIIHQDIPTLESSTPTKNVKRSGIIESKNKLNIWFNFYTLKDLKRILFNFI